MRGPKCRLAALSFALVAGLALGCGGGSSPTEPPLGADSIVLQSISPALGTSLAAGSQVTFTGRVGYTLSSAATGRILLVIQDQANRNLSTTVPQPRVDVTRGSGSAELTDRITIPATGVTSVEVYFPLAPQGVTSTNVVQHVSYAVR